MIQSLSSLSDDVLREVVDGVAVEKPMRLVENIIANLLNHRLGAFCRQTRLGRAIMETLFEIPLSGNDRQFLGSGCPRPSCSLSRNRCDNAAISQRRARIEEL
jgi:hypothetical protein